MTAAPAWTQEAAFAGIFPEEVHGSPKKMDLSGDIDSEATVGLSTADVSTPMVFSELSEAAQLTDKAIYPTFKIICLFKGHY